MVALKEPSSYPDLARTSWVACTLKRIIARDERGRVHRRQATGLAVTDDDCLHSVDSVGADNFGTGDDPQVTTVGTRRSEEAPPKPSRGSFVGRTQDDENAVAALESADRGSAPGAAVAGDDEVDGRDHCVRLAGAGSLTATGPLSVRKNASSCRNSTALSRSGRSSLWPVAAAGARL